MIRSWLFRDDREPGLLLRYTKLALRAFTLARFEIRCRVSRSMLIDERNGHLVVSMTSYGTRVRSAHTSIESIGAGKDRPGRLILWLDEADASSSLPKLLKRCMQRGLEIRVSENFGPHTKYFPTVQELKDSSAVLVTADDDVFYPHFWLSQLAAANRESPDEILCHRAHLILTEDGVVQPYTSWPRVTTNEAGPRVLATGVSGVLYPPRMIRSLRNAGRSFDPVAIHADDIWLHHVALRSGIPVRQLATYPSHFLTTPGTQGTTLASANVEGRRNDSIIANLYSRSDLQRISTGSVGEVDDPAGPN